MLVFESNFERKSEKSFIYLIRQCSKILKYQFHFVESKMSIQICDFNERKHISIIMDLLYKSRDQTADVYFQFNGPDTLDAVRIPAHRNVLAAGSTVLNDLFFGPHKITGDIPTRSTTVISQTFEAFVSLLYGKRNEHFNI